MTLLIALSCTSSVESDGSTFVVVDTMQSDCYDLAGDVITCGAELVGQDAETTRVAASYTVDGDVVLDDNTGLIWETTQAEDIAYGDAADHCAGQGTGGFDDWRLPTITELYSLADFNGALSMDGDSVPYLDTDAFEFEYNDYEMATQSWSSTEYQVGGITGEGSDGVFGFNFADGHIKAYGTERGKYVRCVRGDEGVVGVNDFEVDGDVVIDHATGLTWERSDNGTTRDWESALSYCQELELEGISDWRLPDAKELQSIVDYSVTDVPAIDTSAFAITFDESFGSDGDYGWFWASTTLGDFTNNAVYVAFGRAYSTLDDDSVDFEDRDYYDWHGAGAQRADPKSQDQVSGSRDCEQTACDEQRVDNYVRCVSG